MNDQVAVQLPSGPCFEKHYSLKEVALLWGMSTDTVRRIFENEEGVLRFGHGERLRKRRYISVSIPQSVVERVHRKLMRPAGKVM